VPDWKHPWLWHKAPRRSDMAPWGWHKPPWRTEKYPWRRHKLLWRFDKPPCPTESHRDNGTSRRGGLTWRHDDGTNPRDNRKKPVTMTQNAVPVFSEKKGRSAKKRWKNISVVWWGFSLFPRPKSAGLVSISRRHDSPNRTNWKKIWLPAGLLLSFLLWWAVFYTPFTF
jgi:hypothetical protein